MTATLALPHFNILTFPLGGAQRELRRQERAGFDERITLMPQVAAGGIYGGTNAGAAGVAQGGVVSNWWDGALTAYQPKSAASLAASYINLSNPGTYNAAPGAAPAWDTTNGWIFDGSSYLVNGMPQVNTGDFSILCSAYSDTAIGAQALIANDADGNAIISLRFQAGVATFQVRDTAGLGLLTLQAGGDIHGAWHVLGGRRSGNAFSLWVDGANISNGTSVASDLDSTVWEIGQRAAVAKHAFDGNIRALGFWTTALSDAAMAAKSTTVAAL